MEMQPVQQNIQDDISLLFCSLLALVAGLRAVLWSRIRIRSVRKVPDTDSHHCYKIADERKDRYF